MAVSKTSIANSALIKLGAQRVTNIDPSDGHKNANLCAEQYDKTRQALLRKHPWNCAIKRVKLALTTAPVYEFTNAFELPTDWLRTITVSQDTAGRSEPEYHIEGQTIVSNASDIYLKYVWNLEDPNVMDASFRESLAWMLAADIVLAMTQANTTREQMLKGLDYSVIEARSIDSIEDTPEDEPVDDWVAARMGSSVTWP